MAEVELVIKLDEEYIKQIDKLRFLIGGIEDRSLQVNVINAIKNGKVLPKGHGRVGDLDLAYEAIESYQDLIRSVGKFDADKASALTLLGRCKELISEVDTVIEAEKE